jgi:endo-1,4-beta-xylanase
LNACSRLPFVFASGLLLTRCAVDLSPEKDGDEVQLSSVDAGAESPGAISKTSNSRGTNHDFFYTYWKSDGSVTMTLPGEPLSSGEDAGQFGVSWVGGTYNFVGGKGWNPGSSARAVHYDCDTWSPGSSNAYLTLYGWTTDPLVEYYVVESWGSWRPPGGVSAGQLTTDGGTYDLYEMTRTDAPNITGVNQSFQQYWSVRRSKRASPTGALTITFANHVEAWAAKGWNLGTHDYQVLATEVYNPASRGASNCSVW